jgi:hypothetical protein
MGRGEGFLVAIRPHSHTQIILHDAASHAAGHREAKTSEHASFDNIRAVHEDSSYSLGQCFVETHRAT